jgi:hypothetical protein
LTGLKIQDGSSKEICFEKNLTPYFGAMIGLFGWKRGVFALFQGDFFRCVLP